MKPKNNKLKEFLSGNKGFVLVLSIAIIILVALMSLYDVHLTSRERIKIASLENQLENSKKQAQMYKSELLNQFWELNLLYCNDPELPIVRAVEKSNWSLIHDAKVINIVAHESDKLEVSPVQWVDPIENFAYLPTDNHLEECKEPPEFGWKELKPLANNAYLVPLDEAEPISIGDNSYQYTAIRYTIGITTYYALLVRQPEPPKN